MEISRSQILEQIEKFKKANRAWHDTLDPWFNLVNESKLSDSDKQKTKNELFILAKFINEFTEPLEIIEGIRECPDFIVTSGKKRIGVELSQIILDLKDKQRKGAIKKLLKRAEESLNADNNSRYKGIYEVEFNPLEIMGKNSSEIEEEIKLFFNSKHIANPKYIKSVKWTYPHDSIVFSHGDTYIVGQFNEESLVKAIEKKEVKLKKYEVAATQEQWLLLFTSGIGSEGSFSFIGDETLAKNYQTSFSRIFIFESFGGVIQELNIKSQNQG